VFKRGFRPSFLLSLPLSLEGEGDTGGEGDMITNECYNYEKEHYA